MVFEIQETCITISSVDSLIKVMDLKSIPANAANTKTPDFYSALREPPYDIELEREVLGHLIRNMKLTDQYVTELNEEEFYLDSHRTIFRHIVEVYNREHVVDVMLLRDSLQVKNQLGEVGGIEYLVELVDLFGIEENIDQYVKRLKNKFILRKMLTFAKQLMNRSYQQDEVDEILHEMDSFIADVGGELTEENIQSLSEIMNAVFQEIDSRSHHEFTGIGIPTGFQKLDHCLGGFHAGDFIILAARPTVGKTTLAINFAANASEKGFPVIFFSIEMTKTQVGLRLLSSTAQIDNDRITRGTLSRHLTDELIAGRHKVSRYPFYVDDSSDMNPLKIRARIKKFINNIRQNMKLEEGDAAPDKPALIIVDHLQLLHFEKEKGRGYESREKEMSAISRYLKIIAKELNVVVLAISQLSRAPTKRESPRPFLSDLRDSGSLEQDADVVLLLHRPYAYDMKSKKTSENKKKNTQEEYYDSRETELYVAKHRNGPTDMVKLVFFGKQYRFLERDETMESS